MKEESLLAAICRDPESDELRMEYAKRIQPKDPDRAEFIGLQLEIAALRRHEVRNSSDRRVYPWCPELERIANELLRKNRGRWTQHLARWVSRPTRIVFDRGFPALIEIEPQVFAANPDILFQLAPVRHIDFAQPIDGHGVERTAPFPIDRVVACPQLSRLDSLGFVRAVFLPSSMARNGAVAQLARCPHLTRCAYLAFVSTEITTGDLFDLVAGALTSQMLGISTPEVGELTRIERTQDGARYLKTTFDPRWRDAEREHGYIPWLHRSHNGDGRFDARWLIDHAGFPKYLPRSRPQRDWYEVPAVSLYSLPTNKVAS